ncbi:MAG TPA: winged helix-turn-helix domain-containing protein [Terriglobales bacterium]|jgi:transposase
MRPSGSPEALEVRRYVAARLLAQGNSLTEVAAAVGASVSSVSRWNDALQSGGAQALRARHHPGSKPRLTSRQRQQLLGILGKGARRWGFVSDEWTAPRVKVVIERKFGVVYHVDYVGTLLHRMGWSPQKPEQRAREGDEEQIAAWRREVWPQIKKGQRTSS